jgi:uncharacterized protein YneF (UPF0154 family)
MNETLTLLLLQLPHSDAFGRALTIVIVSMSVIVFMSVVAFIVIRMVKRDIFEDNPGFAKDSVLKAQAELMVMAKKKRDDGERAEDMAQKLGDQNAVKNQEAEERKLAQESARETLLHAAEAGIGASCPHCQIAMEEDESLVVCPVCGVVQHSVCFSNGGCASGCTVEYVYEFPEGNFKEVVKKAY